MSVGRICNREVAFAHPDESVLEAAVLMRDRNVGTLVVLDHWNRPIGIVTDRDAVTRCLAEERWPAETKIAEVMTRDPKTVSEDTPIEVALSFMQTGGFRRLPVVNHKGELVGLISLDDILGLLAEEFTQIGDLLARETPRRETVY